MPDIVPGVPWRWVPSPNHGGPRAKTLGVFIHSTRGGTDSLESDYQATVRYCARVNSSQVGPHFVVGPAEVTRMIHDEDTCWCQTVDNPRFLSIEVAQPRKSTPFSDFQYEAAADICARLSIEYGFPAVRIPRQTTPTVEVPGIIGHEDSRAGWERGKTDPGPMWDWSGFIARVAEKVAELTEPDPWEGVDARLRAWCEAHPDLGRLQSHRVWAGWEAVDLLGADRRISVAQLRKWTGEVQAMTYQMVRP